MTDAPKVDVFFYGSFINRDVLAQVDLVPDHVEPARLDGYDIVIRPLANVVRAEGRSVHGIVAQATHDELARLYGQEWLDTYLPHPVAVEVGGGTRAVLCYMAPKMKPAQARDDYLDRIVGPAKAYGFPDWYIERLESYRAGSQRMANG